MMSPMRTPCAAGLGTVLVAAIVLLAPIPAQATGESPEPPIVLEPVTISVKNLDIKEVLSMLSSSRQLNFIFEEDVAGKVSLDLNEVPFYEAMRSAVAMAGYEVVRKGNIFFVRTPQTTDDITRALHDIRTFRLGYAQPADVQGVLAEIISANGKVLAYDATRSLVVEDRADVLDRVALIIEQLDRPPRQVMIEAEILEVRLSHDMRFGIDWSLVFSEGTGSGTIDNTGFSGEAGGTSEGFFVAWAKGDFASQVEALEGVEDLTTLASPRLLAVDGEEAEIIIGGQLGFAVVTTVEGTIIQSVEFLDTGAQLRITPTIADDGHVLMKVNPEVSDGLVQEGMPSKTTAQVTSGVLVADGQTLLIGGLIRERDETTRSGIPLLMRIPILGGLFGRVTHEVSKSELIVLITPHIVAPGENAPYEGAGLITPELD